MSQAQMYEFGVKKFASQRAGVTARQNASLTKWWRQDSARTVSSCIVSNAMSYEDLDGLRPVKKRRFFDEGPDDTPQHPESDSAELSIAETHEQSGSTNGNGVQNANGGGSSTGQEDTNGFDVGLLSAFVGEDLPESVVVKLRHESGGDMHKGMDWIHVLKSRLFVLTIWQP